MSSQSYMTASLLRPLLSNLLVACKPGEPNNIHQAKAVLYHDMEKRCVVLFFNVSWYLIDFFLSLNPQKKLLFGFAFPGNRSGRLLNKWNFSFDLGSQLCE